MDVKEMPTAAIRVRHPWELARVNLVKTILYPFLSDIKEPKILDIGCGDRFLISEISSEVSCSTTVAVDTELEDFIDRPQPAYADIKFTRDVEECEKEWADALLLDVIEHQEDDLVFLKDLTKWYVKSCGVVLVTVPAFNSLFSQHDEFLGHYRRYSRNELQNLVTASGLILVRSGYAFSSLLVPRLVIKLLEKTFKNRSRPNHLGEWQHGKVFTEFVRKVLEIDNSILMKLSESELHLPGLTTWALCKKS